MSITKSEIIVWSMVTVALAGVVVLALFTGTSSTVVVAPAPAQTGPDTTSAFELAGLAPERTSQLLPEPAGQMGSFPCVERSGRAANTSELLGRFAVVDFIFTNCGGPCPMMTAAMARLQDELKGADDVRLVSFSVDPERDTPQVLSEYADRHRADKERWLFFRAEMPEIREIAYDRMKLVKSRDEPVVHSSMFALLDREGRVRAYYSPLDDAKWLAKLVADLAVLRGEPSK